MIYGDNPAKTKEHLAQIACTKTMTLSESFESSLKVHTTRKRVKTIKVYLHFEVQTMPLAAVQV